MIKKTSERPTRSMKAFRKTLVSMCRGSSVDEIVLKDLCEKAGFTAMAFYYCYDDKYDLAKDVVDSEIYNLKKIGWSSVTRISYENFEADYIAETEKLFGYIHDNIETYRCIAENRLMPDSFGYMTEEMITWFRENMHFTAAGDITDLAYTDLMIRIRYTDMFTIISYWVKRGCDISPKKLAIMTMDILGLHRSRVALNSVK